MMLAVGYAAWQALGMVPVHSSEDKKEEKKPTINLFGVTPKRAENVQRGLFYVGLLLFLYLFLFNKIAAIIAFAVCILAGLVFKRILEIYEARVKRDMVYELPVFLDTFLSLYTSGLKMETAIQDSLVVTKRLPIAFEPVLAKWHDRGGPEIALKTLVQFNIADLKTCATMMIQLVRGGERSIEFLREWKDQLTIMEHLKQEAGSAAKPIYFTFLLGLPFSVSIVTWFYPFFVQAMHMFDGFLF